MGINALSLQRSKMMSVKPPKKLRLQPIVRPQFQLVEFLLLRMSYDYRNSVPSASRFIPKYRTSSRRTQAPGRGPGPGRAPGPDQGALPPSTSASRLQTPSQQKP